MSWDDYITSLVGHSNAANCAHIDKACLIDVNSGAQWTTDGHPNAFHSSDAERSKLAAEMKKGDKSGLGATGIVLGGTKYQFLRYDEDAGAAYGKKKGEGAITVHKSKQVMIIAHCPEGGQHGICNNAVSKVIAYLAEAGY